MQQIQACRRNWDKNRQKSGPIMFYHTITTYTTTWIQGMIDCGVVVGRNKAGRLRYGELPK